jgi:O-antigen ligase
MPTIKITPSLIALNLAVFLTILFGILWQGGAFFWFGFAGASSTLLLIIYLNNNYQLPLTLPKSPTNIFVLLFSAWSFLTVIWSVVPHISLVRAFTIFSAPVGIYSYFLLTHSAIKWENLWRIFILIGFVLVAYSIIEVYIGIPAPNSLFLNQNTHATYLNLIILPTVAYFLLADNSRLRLFLGISLFLLIFSHGLPGSRGAMLGQFIGLLMIFFGSKRDINFTRLKQLFGIYAVALILASFATNNLSRFAAYEIRAADHGRLEIWEGAINLLKDTPWYGSGAGTYWLTHPAYRHINETSSGQNPHNDYLQFLIEVGVPGLALLLLIVFSLLFYWWKTIRKKDCSLQTKIEASAIVGAISAIGFHAFFTFNFGVYAILFLTGILLGRLFFITGQTRKTPLLGWLPIRKQIFSFSALVISILLLFYFVAISAFSNIYTRAVLSSNKGDITNADRLNSIAMSIYPYDDRPYLLYAQIFEEILEKVVELTPSKKQAYYQNALTYLDQAQRINPYRPANYFIKARIIETNPELEPDNWAAYVEELYKKSLKTNPRYINATKQLTNFYLAQDNPKQAVNTLINQVKYWHPATKNSLRFYNFAEPIINQFGTEEDIVILKNKMDVLIEALKRKGLETTNDTSP